MNLWRRWDTVTQIVDEVGAEAVAGGRWSGKRQSTGGSTLADGWEIECEGGLRRIRQVGIVEVEGEGEVEGEIQVEVDRRMLTLARQSHARPCETPIGKERSDSECILLLPTFLGCRLHLQHLQPTGYRLQATASMMPRVRQRWDVSSKNPPARLVSWISASPMFLHQIP